MSEIIIPNGKSASELFDILFTAVSLQKIFEQYLSESRAVGADGVSLKNFKAELDVSLSIIVRKVKAKTYKFTPFKLKLISKGPEKIPRAISVPTIRDRLVLRILNEILIRVFPEASSKIPHTYIPPILSSLSGCTDNLAFVRIDVKDFYPSVQHDQLFRKLRRKIRKEELLLLLRTAVSTRTQGMTRGLEGIPQGLNISNILASIYLCSFDKRMSARWKFFRYVDDILIICFQEEAQKAFQEISKALARLGLQCHALGTGGKSEIVPVNKGIDYLGFHIRPSSVSVRESSYKKMFDNLLRVFTSYAYIDAAKRNEKKFISRLNLKITGCIFQGRRYGWMFFFSQINDLRQLGRLDNFVRSQLQKRDLSHLEDSVARFIKSYHEIRFKLEHTKYIPKFDEWDIRQMIETLHQFDGTPLESFRTLTDLEIRARFERVLRRETRELERDLVEAFS